MKMETASKRRRLSHQIGDDLASDFGRLLVDGALSDISFVLDDASTIMAHRVVLSARSQYFRNLFSNRFRESSQQQIQATGCTRSAFMITLRYIYTDALKIEEQTSAATLVDAFRLADKYLMEKYALLLEQSVLGDLSVESAVEVLHAARGLDTLSAKVGDRLLQLPADHLHMERILALYLEAEGEPHMQPLQERLTSEILVRLQPTNAAAMLHSVSTAGCNAKLLNLIQDHILKLNLRLVVQCPGSVETLQADAPHLLASICKALAGNRPDQKWNSRGGHWRVCNDGLIANFRAKDPDRHWKGISRDHPVQVNDEFSVRILCVNFGPVHSKVAAVRIVLSHLFPPGDLGAAAVRYYSNGRIKTDSCDLASDSARAFGEGSVVTFRVDGSQVTCLKDGTLAGVIALPEGGPYYFAVEVHNCPGNALCVELINCHAL